MFYPFKQGQMVPGTKTKFDELAYYAERFNTVEINDTFYRPPAVKTAQSWARTPSGFEFNRQAALMSNAQPHLNTGKKTSDFHRHPD